MKVTHWTLKNGSGLAAVAFEMSAAEKALGIDSVLIDSTVKQEWAIGLEADVHVIHSALPDVLHSHPRKVFIAHGTPEHCFEQSVLDSAAGKNGGFLCDAWNLTLYWMQKADVMITFWDRHKAIWDSFRPKDKPCLVLPMAVDKTKFFPAKQENMFPGTPVIFSSENSHAIKWPLELLLSWARIHSDFPEGRLTLAQLPLDQIKYWGSLVSHAGIYPKTFLLTHAYKGEGLRAVLSSSDYYANLVRYGDHNRMGIEAAACGAKVISYAGNPYAHYWISSPRPEHMDDELKAILRGEVTAREIAEIKDTSEVALQMKEIYDKLCA